MRSALDEHAASLPGAFMVVQWGDAHVYKVGPPEKAKVFAILGLQANRVTVKCQDVDTADFLIEIGAAERAKYLPRGGWVSFDMNYTALDDLLGRIDTSYDTVRAGLTKAVQAALPPR